MQPFTRVCGVAAPLPQSNIDTDVIMPKQFLKGITRQGLANGVLYDLRFDGNGRERDDFVLNLAAYRAPAFLVVGENFGCGSSREHAVWGLKQYGIRALLGTSFASIFSDNCFGNGLLVIELEPAALAKIQSLCADPRSNSLCVDLIEQTISLADGAAISFAIDPMRRDGLLHGRDRIAATLQFAADIQAFETRLWEEQPWLKASAHRPAS
jgi:3-isopropylmalate/(R)-2-methylmalate dehydratase small subunit